MRTADIFKALSDPIRLRLVYLLTRHDQLCVCQMTEILDLSQSGISRHLALLRGHGLVDSERHGRWVFYRLRADDELIRRITAMLEQMSEFESTFRDDLARLRPPPAEALAQLNRRPGA